jgi:hypothetical protein
MIFWGLFLFIFFHINIMPLFDYVFVHQSDWKFFEQVFSICFLLLKIYKKHANLFGFALFK